jgi:hypothetical protein
LKEDELIFVNTIRIAPNKNEAGFVRGDFQARSNEGGVDCFIIFV